MNSPTIAYKDCQARLSPNLVLVYESQVCAFTLSGQAVGHDAFDGALVSVSNTLVGLVS